MSSHHLSHDDYTVGWICALSSEFAAAKAMLDSTHPRLPQAGSDHNSYALGEIAGHNVVIACLPAGVYGTTSATSVAKDMLSSYREIRYALMVGIGGGAPSKNNDIRLGDVVVSQPTGSSGGVIQYDHGKAMNGGQFQPTGVINKPPHVFLTALSNLKSDEILGRDRLQEFLSQALEKYAPISRFTFPGSENDRLFRSEYSHPSSEVTCDKCDQDMQIMRPARYGPRVFYGLVASANQVMKDSLARDRLAKEHNILCFEMEAAGLMDHLPCLVIRGICDYSDSHKNKDWQEYAALTAAAYAKCVLLMTSIHSTRRNKTNAKDRLNDFQPTPEDISCLKSLFITDPEEDRESLRRSRGKRAQGTCEWIFKTEEIASWLKGVKDSEPSVLWLYGNPGTGKSTMAITIAEKISNQRDFVDSGGTLAYFFCDSAHEGRRTATAILRGLLYQLQRQHPHFLEHFRRPFSARGESIFNSFDTLWSMFLSVMHDKLTGHKYCIIDALDECDENSQHILLSQLDHYHRNASQEQQGRVHILITSRPYPEIFEYLHSFPHKDLGEYIERKEDIKRMINEKVQELKHKKAYTDRIALDVTKILQEKSEGTFLWIGIACQELSKIRSRDAVKTLQKLPRGLDSLYHELLTSAIEQNPQEEQKIAEILHFVAVAQTTMTVSMLSHACQSYTDEPDAERVTFFREDISMCRLMVIIQDDFVRLLHKSVKDFVLETQSEGITQSLKAHATLAYRCIDYLCKWAMGGEGGDLAFLQYAANFWPQHAQLASTSFSILDEQEAFYRYESVPWMKWLEQWNQLLGPRSALDITGFTILHVAAEWNLEALARLGLEMLEKNTLGARSSKYSDREFQGPWGKTPLVLAAQLGNTNIMSMLLSRVDEDVVISTEVMHGIVGNYSSGGTALRLLFSNPLLQPLERSIEITESILELAARNQKCGYDIWEMIIREFGDTVRAEISESVIKHAASNATLGSRLVKLIGESFPGKLSTLVKHEVLESAILNERQNVDVLAALLIYAPVSSIMGHTIQTAMSNRWNGREMAVLLFSHADRTNLPAERLILLAASHSTELCRDLIRMTLNDQQEVKRPQISMTLQHLIIRWSDVSLINLFLLVMGSEIVITKGMVCMAGDEDVKVILAARLTDQSVSTINGQSSPSIAENGLVPAFHSSLIKQISILDDHTDEVWCSAFSSDGLKFASGGRDKVVRVYHWIGFKPVETLLYHESFITSLQWSPDNRRLISGGYDGMIQIWDAETYGSVAKLQCHELGITGISWASDGQSFFSSSPDLWFCHWTDAGSPLHTEQTRSRALVSCISPDGTELLLANSDQNIDIYATDTYQHTVTIRLEGNPSSIQMESGTNLALLDFRRGGTQIVDLTDARVIQRFESARLKGTYVTQSRYFGVGNSLILGGSENGRICVWDRHTGSLLDVVAQHSHGCVNSISVNPANPNMFISTGDDCTVRVWEMNSDEK